MGWGSRDYAESERCGGASGPLGIDEVKIRGWRASASQLFERMFRCGMKKGGEVRRVGVNFKGEI